MDCGGGCPRACPTGQGCVIASDCDSRLCSNSTCRAPTCSDGVANGLETDIDCGGSNCAPCGDWNKCALGSDCGSKVCNVTANLCVPSSCTDGALNGNETDIDCGGNCTQCDAGKECRTNDDCISKSCAAYVCVLHNCYDNIFNGNETGVDCGGGCPRACPTGQGCVIASDCDSRLCSNSTCRAPTCSDGVANGLETDIDCGGSNCAPCGDWNKCALGSDCGSKVCNVTANLCVPSSCTDGALNGNETDIDCGGNCAECSSDCADPVLNIVCPLYSLSSDFEILLMGKWMPAVSLFIGLPGIPSHLQLPPFYTNQTNITINVPAEHRFWTIEMYAYYTMNNLTCHASPTCQTIVDAVPPTALFLTNNFQLILEFDEVVSLVDKLHRHLIPKKIFQVVVDVLTMIVNASFTLHQMSSVAYLVNFSGPVDTVKLILPRTGYHDIAGNQGLADVEHIYRNTSNATASNATAYSLKYDLVMQASGTLQVATPLLLSSSVAISGISAIGSTLTGAATISKDIISGSNLLRAGYHVQILTMCVNMAIPAMPGNTCMLPV